ncbi:hypothetical protein [Cellulomonas soli]|uniref:Helix-turn-helix domain-containing protein n=1 Tax=Cellulomonas soli TaxID=931535 RepID=A0A512PHK4_9CELL|nr:hypothetical protein [Cellulomonas soli]NYI59163.1 hypothetical protein [Cellulomonas soli]GEP70667.1 hypothetical protein CSO01_33820 [Cellulomonas soli]
MSIDTPYEPQIPPPGEPCPDPLTQLVTVQQLADRLGLSTAAIRQALHVGAAWLPRPDGRINGGAVWRSATLVGIEDTPRRAPGRPRREVPELAEPSAQPES